MDAKEIKKRLYEEERIEELLEILGCQNIHREQYGKLICAQLPPEFDSDNKRSVQVKVNESLSSNIRSRNIHGDIYNVIGYILYHTDTSEKIKERFYEIVQYVCNLFDYELSINEKKTDWCYFLRPVQKERNKELYLENIPENDILNDNVMDKYLPYLHHKWCNEGINHKTRDIFDIRFDLETARIVFPIHNKNGKLIGVKGRSVTDDIDNKYIFLYPCLKTLELFNLHRATEFICERKEVIVFESEKSCMLATQWGVENCVALMGCDLSPVQTKLLREFGLDVEITFMFDADKDIEFIGKQIRQIKNRNVSYVPVYDYFKDKLSPTDVNREEFIRLLGLKKY